MNPSKLNKRITIQQEITNKKDEEGNPIPPEWKDVVTVWARAKTPFGKGFNYEIFAGNTENAVRTVNFLCDFVGELIRKCEFCMMTDSLK